MGMPWFKMPTDEDFCLHAIGPVNESYYHALLRIKGRGQLDQPLSHTHIPQFHSKLTRWMAKLIGITAQRAAKLKETLMIHGLIDDYWQPLNWEQRYGPGAHRHTETRTDEAQAADKPALLSEAEKKELKRKKDAEKQARYRANVASKAQNVTHGVTQNVTRVTDSVTPALPVVTKDTVTQPENAPKNTLDDQQVTKRYQNPLDVRALDLDSKSLKATATRETTTQAPPSTPGVNVTHVTTQAKTKATTTATATTDDLPASPLSPKTHSANDSAPILSTVEAPSVHANDPDKGFIHADKKPAKKYPVAPMTLKHYLRIRRERGLNVIDDDHPIDQWAKERGFPTEFLTIAWEVFEEKHSKGLGKRYRYDYWPQRFFDAVKDNQYGLWKMNEKTKEYSLSTRGLQAFMDIDIKKNREQSETEIKKQISLAPAPTAENEVGKEDGGAWFLAELKRRYGDEFNGIFSEQQFIHNANIH